MANLCNLDGVILPEADARIPVLDRGFLFGDSIYEVVRTWGEVPFAFPEHWARLLASAEGLRMALDLDQRTVARRIAATVAQAGHGDSYVRVVVTRGAGEAPNIDLAYATAKPCWVILVRPAPRIAGLPAKLAAVDRLRNDRRALDPATKSGNYLNSVLGLAEAKDQGATDCAMFNAQGELTEASTSNLFVCVDGVWCTPPLEAGILAGITRALLLAFLAGRGEGVREQHLRRTDLDRAEEMFLSSSLRDIAPVTHWNGRALHGGGPGPRTAVLMPAFAQHCAGLLRDRYAPAWRALVAE